MISLKNNLLENQIKNITLLWYFGHKCAAISIYITNQFICLNTDTGYHKHILQYCRKSHKKSWIFWYWYIPIYLLCVGMMDSHRSYLMSFWHQTQAFQFIYQETSRSKQKWTLVVQDNLSKYKSNTLYFNYIFPWY